MELMKEIKRVEFPDKVIARLTGKTEKEIRQMRYDYGVTAHFKMVDTCAAEFDAMTPYVDTYCGISVDGVIGNAGITSGLICLMA